MSWRVAKSLLKLRDQIDAAFPNRSKASDGTIGDAAHASRSSDHDPWVKDGSIGVVTAMDLTHDPAHGFDSYRFAEILRLNKDRRIKYIISNKRIASPNLKDWAWRHYGGPNPHNHHVHISVRSDKEHYDSAVPWRLENETVLPERLEIQLGASGGEVLDLQHLLGVMPTGIFDPATRTAVKNYQELHNLKPDGIVGSATWASIEGAAVSEEVVYE